MKCLFALATVLAATSLATVPGCGGEERLSREDFSARIQSIGERGGELWERLAQRAQDLEPDQPLPADVKQALTDLVDFQEQAVEELEALNPPEDAEEPVEMLVEALRARTEIFEQVIEAGRFTRQDSDQTTESGDKIDAAFEQLRKAGFLPEADEHEEE
jgi:DNA repair ATPase RecN